MHPKFLGTINTSLLTATGLTHSEERLVPKAEIDLSFFVCLSCQDHLLQQWMINVLCLSAGGLSLWLILWLVVVKPGGVSACPRLCVCYPTPMTVSCQSQNLTIVPAGVPYDSQRVFLQNNRITELRADSFGFETQVNK